MIPLPEAVEPVEKYRNQTIQCISACGEYGMKLGRWCHYAWKSINTAGNHVWKFSGKNPSKHIATATDLRGPFVGNLLTHSIIHKWTDNHKAGANSTRTNSELFALNVATESD